MNKPDNHEHPTIKAAEAVTEAITSIIGDHDPRALVQGLLMSAVTLAQSIIEAKRWTHQQVAIEFSQALCASLEAQAKKKSAIQIADATGRIRHDA